MTSEIRLFSKDRIRLNILEEVLNGTLAMTLQLNNLPEQDYAKEIHEEGKRVYVYGKFNISEDANGGNSITVRHISVDAPLKIALLAKGELTDKKVSVIRGATKETEREFVLTPETESIELIPQDGESYLMRINSDAELQEISREISEIGSQREKLAAKKQGAKKKLETMRSELQKDQASYQSELDELKARMEIDGEVLKHYADRDIAPTESILEEARKKLDEAEAQIRLFIEARQRKTMEIESEIKSGKRQ